MYVRSRELNLVQENIVDALLKKYQLSPENLAVLQGTKRDPLLTYEIFTVLEKVQNIHNDCKVLMQSGLQTLASDVMEQMTIYQV